MSSFWSLFKSTSSGSRSSTTTTTATPSNFQQERKRVNNLREDHTAQPLTKWDNQHCIQWLTSLNCNPQYIAAAKTNLLTGSSLLRIHRAHQWDSPQNGLGITSMEDLNKVTNAFDKRRRQVIVRVYDVTGGLGPKGKSALLMVNKIFRSSLGGAYHCGVEVYGLEWAFGDGGVYCTYPKKEIMGHHFREVVRMPIGTGTAAPDVSVVSDRCLLDQREVRKLCDGMKKMWPGSRYDLVHCNCCHFADALCKALGVGTIPLWINRAARIGAGADVTWLSSNVPEVNKDMRGSKEDQQAKAMYESATQLFKDGLITREEYRNLREKHKRYVDEVCGKAGPAKQAQIQTTSVVPLLEATKEAQVLLKNGIITKEEYEMIVNAHTDASDDLGHRKRKESSGSSRDLSKQERVLGIGIGIGIGAPKNGGGEPVVELDLEL